MVHAERAFVSTSTIASSLRALDGVLAEEVLLSERGVVRIPDHLS